MAASNTDEPAAELFSSAVAGPLQTHVSGIHGFDIRRSAPLSHMALPGPIVPVIFAVDHDYTLRTESGGATRVGSFVAGVAGEAVLVEAERFTGVQVNLTPLGAWRVFGPVAADLAGQIVSVDEVFGASPGSLARRLGALDTWDDRFGFVTDLLMAQLDADYNVAPEVDRAWDVLTATDGQIAVGALAAEVGWSPRHLSSRFRDVVGMSPKRTARLLRFHAAAGLIGGDTPLADIAYVCGYSDQSHFSNEVAEHAGMSPRALRSELLATGRDGVSQVDGGE